MLLLIDIGNSNICFGLHDKNTLINTYRIKSMTDKSSDEYYILFNTFIKEKIDDVVISSVVPPITSAIKKMVEKYYNITPKILGVGMVSISRWESGKHEPTMTMKRKLKELFIEAGMKVD